jgi:hypothetical protein
MTNSLWPKKIVEKGFTAPAILIADQANFLGELTKNVVTAEVTRVSHTGSRSLLKFSFWLVAPALQGYRFLLFEFSHQIELYPIKILSDSKLLFELSKMKDEWKYDPNSGISIDNEENLMILLSAIFNSERTTGVINGLIAQSDIKIKNPDDEIPF